VVGVDDRLGGADALVGSRLGIDATRHRIFELTEPGLVVAVESLTRVGRELIVINVPASPTVHAVAGRCTERIGASCEPMTPERIATVVADRRAEDWSAQDSGVDPSRVDPVAVGVARALLARLPDPMRSRSERQRDADLLRALGVVTGHATLTNAGALLFTNTLEGEQLAYAYRRTPTGALVVNEHHAGPLLSALQRIFDLVDARVERTSVNVAGGQQLQVADLPEAAVREALINAVMHRDYRRRGHVVAEHTPTRFAVTSPGPFLDGITPQNVLTTSSRTRNPQLATAIRALGLAETAGAGVDRMFASMARIGHQPPVYTAGLDQVEVVLAGGAPNAYVARFTASLPAEDAEDADTMLVLLALLGRRTINAAAAAPLLQRTDVEAQSVLARLSAPPIAMVESTRETANRARPNYRLRADVLSALGPAVTYNRRTTDDYDRKIVGLVRETGEVNGRMVRLLLDLDVVSASRVLAELVERQVLVKTSRAQRGPSVTYGPGSAFPSVPRREQSRASAGTPRSGRQASTKDGSR
jgi:ATP-dependent DNA helicase RecG